jgi:hypothetical protein
MNYMLVPAAPASSFEALIYYLTQQVAGIPLVEVGNVSQAIPYAFGHAAPSPLSVNFSQGYDLGIPQSNVTCAGCNASAFPMLVGSTMNFSEGYAMNISGAFGSAKSQLIGNLNAYRALQGKGYRYTAADFAFLDFGKVFTLYNARDLNESYVGLLESNISSYCASVTPPPLTDTNYEYVSGGDIRLYWANMTLNDSEALLNASETTDDVAQSLYESSEALGWCKAAGIQFQIASSLGGNYVAVSPGIRSYVSGQINAQAGLSGDLYSRTMRQAYAAGDYATALYATEYENAFGTKAAPALNGSQLATATSANIRNASAGVWPSQFAAQAEFYINEANATRNASAAEGYLQQAYSTSVLAAGLASANARLSGSFVPANYSNTSSGSVQQQLEGLRQSVSSLQQQLAQVYVVLLVVTVLVFVLLAAMLVMLLRQQPQAVRGTATARPRARAGKRKTR